MRFFNIDQHASVIADVAHIFKSLGHQVDDWSLSGHHWVMGKNKPKIMLSDGTQLTCSGVCSQEVCDKFYEKNKDELNKYDAFIACYPVEFAMLYERWNKPIIIINCVRYDHPNTFNPILRDRLNIFLKSKFEQEKLYFVCNNKGDQWYTKYFTGIEGTHIPSFCEYTSTKYTGIKNKYIIHDRTDIMIDSNLATSLGSIRSSDWRYSWQDLYSYKGVIHIPYHNGSMSIFEQYTANIPLFMPSKQYMKELFYCDKALSDLTFYKINKEKEPDDIFNPNSLRNPEILNKWIDSCDFYDDGNMPYIQYFESPNHLEQLLKKVNTNSISYSMAAYNITRKQSIYNNWQQILTSIASRI